MATPKDTKSWLLQVIVDMITEAKDGKIVKPTYCEAILEGFANKYNYQRENNRCPIFHFLSMNKTDGETNTFQMIQ